MIRISPGAHQDPLEARSRAHELLVLVLGAEAHHPLDAGAVVPTAVEEDHLAAGRQLGDVALEVPLAALSLGRLAERHRAHHARVGSFGDPLDHATLAGGVAPLEEHRNPQASVDDPLLQPHQLLLKAGKLLLVLLLGEKLGGVIAA